MFPTSFKSGGDRINYPYKQYNEDIQRDPFFFSHQGFRTTDFQELRLYMDQHISC